ncbi:hypothetical protein Taro_021256 [Colocasia esculenta]|uniref:Uncharacterized protein n=1 Tax=Colocasia esculenta TaxID=4460 RepID=A0A843V7N9_COLES|nr:hypothetical protein [Colocasia esculenta]
MRAWEAVEGGIGTTRMERWREAQRWRLADAGRTEGSRGSMKNIWQVARLEQVRTAMEIALPLEDLAEAARKSRCRDCDEEVSSKGIRRWRWASLARKQKQPRNSECDAVIPKSQVHFTNLEGEGSRPFSSSLRETKRQQMERRRRGLHRTVDDGLGRGFVGEGEGEAARTVDRRRRITGPSVSLLSENWNGNTDGGEIEREKGRKALLRDR